MSDEIIKRCPADDNSLAPALNDAGNKTRVKFDENSSKQDKITFNHGKIVNICIVYELSSDPALENYLFGAVIDKNKYSGYGIGFDSKVTLMFPNGEFACSIIIFEADMISSVHVDKKKKDILIAGEGPTQGIDGKTLTTEKLCSINLTKY